MHLFPHRHVLFKPMQQLFQHYVELTLNIRLNKIVIWVFLSVKAFSPPCFFGIAYLCKGNWKFRGLIKGVCAIAEEEAQSLIPSLMLNYKVIPPPLWSTPFFLYALCV